MWVLNFHEHIEENTQLLGGTKNLTGMSPVKQLRPSHLESYKRQYCTIFLEPRAFMLLTHTLQLAHGHRVLEWKGPGRWQGHETSP